MAAKATKTGDPASVRRSRKKDKSNSAKETSGGTPTVGFANPPASKRTMRRPDKLQINVHARKMLEESLKTPIVEATISMQDTEIYRTIEPKLVSGGLLTNDPIVFSGDSSLFYLSKDNAVAVYNVENGEMVQNFSAQQHQQHQLIGVPRLHPSAIKAMVADQDESEGHRVYTFSADHKARLWDADTGELLHVWDLGTIPAFAVADPTKPGHFFCALWFQHIKAAGGDKHRYSICRVVLDRNQGTAMKEELFRVNNPTGLVVRHDGQWLAAYSKFRVQLAHLRPNGTVVQHMWRMSERVSVVAFHPGEPVLAVGDWRGRIMFWFCVDEDLEHDTEDRDIIRRPHHWHAHRVNAVAFTEGGSTMLSGGEEGVLVLWQLATESRDYLPRLGSDIIGIAVSPDQMYYAVTLRDNTIRIFSAMNKSLVSSLQGLKFAERGAALAKGRRAGIEHARLARALDDDPFTTGLVVHPATHSLVLNGDPGFLQVFNHLGDRHLASIEVASFNRTGGSSSDDVSRPHVDLVQYSSDGTWMATVDSRRTDASRGLMAVTGSYLKFWRLDPSDQTYKLASRIDNPHSGGVHAIAFQPVLRKGSQQRDSAGLLCVSTGRDSTFRVWELQTLPSAQGDAPHSFWSCRASAQYRGLEPHGAAFSADGSTLAVTFGGAITLWDALTCTAPVATLVASAATPRLTGAAFIGGSAYLTAWSAERLDVWNMLTGSVWWTLAMPIRDVFVHQRAALLAVVAYQIPGSSTASIMVYSPASPTPLAALQHPGGVEAVALVPAPASAKSGRSHPDTEEGQPKPDPLDDNTLVVLTPTGLISVYGAES
ncbi:NET1-associated nuclear protein 1, partial [Coemansia biformis]